MLSLSAARGGLKTQLVASNQNGNGNFVVERLIALVAPLEKPLQRDQSLHYEITWG